MKSILKILRQNGIQYAVVRRNERDKDVLLYNVAVSTENMSEIWQYLQSEFNHTNYWPVFIDDLNLINNTSRIFNSVTTSQILKEARFLDPEEWLIDGTVFSVYPNANQVLEQVLEDTENEYTYLGKSFINYEYMREAAKDALKNEDYWIDKTSLSSKDRLGINDSNASAEDRAALRNLVLFPVLDWWEIPALLRYYPTDPGPPPSVHVSLFRRWSSNFGAELVSLGRRSLTLRAIQPPQERTTAITLAWEHSQYCQTIPVLEIMQRAVKLFAGGAWNFWWD